MGLLYFRTEVSPNPPTAGSKSLTLPNGTDRSITTNDDESLSVAQGGTNVLASITTAAQTARQSGRFGRLTSAPLATQDWIAGSWSVNPGLRRESNNAANAFLALSIYIWRPSTSSRVGFIYDANTQLGAEWPTTAAAATYTILGQAISILDGDVLVVELWYTAAQGMATSYTTELRWGLNGFIESVDNDFTFYIPPKETSFAHIIY
jgi:hypothetical protein